MAPLKANRKEKLLQVAIHLLEKKTEQLTCGGACFSLQSSGGQVVARRYKAESQLWLLLWDQQPGEQIPGSTSGNF